jgi:mRNA-degrading endonuclease toxin of MazEF toxin-antitoxin module
VSDIDPRRGHIYRVAIEPEITVLVLLVSGDWLNRQSTEYAAVQVTSARVDQSGFPGSVRLTAGDPAFGWIVCRDIGMVAHEELKEDLGPVSAETLMRTGTALKQALGL